MKSFAILLVFTSQLIGTIAAASADPLAPLPALYKLSQAIRGIPPDEIDKIELAAAEKSGTISVFLDHKAESYLKSPNHAVKMTFRFSELFRVRSPELLPGESPKVNSENPDIPSPPADFADTSLAELFSRVSERNLSLDELAAGRDYRVFSNGYSKGFSAISDFGFFQRLANLPSQTQVGNLADTSLRNESQVKTCDIHFKADERQIAGAITTPRFFERYANSQTNHNRRRAAAIYRIFLCDSMSPVVPASEGNDPEITKLLYPDHSQVSETTLTASSEKLHGTQSLCISCHQKLDPLGQVFDTSPISVSRVPSPGALVFLRHGLESIPVSDFTELGRKLVEQPEYKRCQVRHVWNWFVGSDLPLSATHLDELVNKFDSVGHRLNDFIRVVVREPEFSTRLHPTEQTRLTQRVLQVFERCQECHQSSTRYAGPDLTSWPLQSSKVQKSPASWLSSIQEKIDLKGHGASAKMPPRSATWKLTTEDFDSIQKWISQGAPDSLGRKQL